jgi:hypothetical protein
MTIAHFGMIYESKDAKREHGPVWSRRDKDKARGLLENGGPFYRDVGTEVSIQSPYFASSRLTMVTIG